MGHPGTLDLGSNQGERPLSIAGPTIRDTTDPLPLPGSGKVAVPRWMLLAGAVVAQVLFTLAMASAPVLGLAQAVVLLAVGMYAILRRDLTLVICVIAFTTGCEVLWRQIRVPMFWLGATYLVILLSAFAVLFVLQRLGKVARIATLYFVLMLPAVVATIRTTGSEAREIIAFALSGPAALAAFVAFTSQVSVKPWLYRRILWIVLISAVGPLTQAVSTLIENLGAGGLSFGTQSNFAASGGFGPVQVSSMLSLGVMAALLLVIIERNLSIRILAAMIAVAMGVQTLLTFSRGGSFSFGLAVAALAIFQARNRRIRNTVIVVTVAAFTLAQFLVFPWLDTFTDGAFQARFSDTQTGRTDLATNDVEIFAQNPVLGVGPGMTKYQRLTYEICEIRSDKCKDEGSSHTEFTRMLSEHGLPGVISVGLLALMAWHAIRRAGPGQAFAIAWITWALSQMVYANLRIVAVPFAFGLAFLRMSSPATGPPEEELDRQPPQQRTRSTPHAPELRLPPPPRGVQGRTSPPISPSAVIPPGGLNGNRHDASPGLNGHQGPDGRPIDE